MRTDSETDRAERNSSREASKVRRRRWRLPAGLSKCSSVAALALSLVACGNSAEFSDTTEQGFDLVDDPSPSPLGENAKVEYRVGGRNECSREVDKATAIAALHKAKSLAIARIKVLEECSSLGGNHVFAESLDVVRGDARNALQTGGHGCPTFTVGASKPYVDFEAYAVVGYRATVEEEVQGGDAWCVLDKRDGTIDAMAIFVSADKAEAFLKTL